jgi:hypothetical protein
MAVDLVGEDAGIASLMTTDVVSISRLVLTRQPLPASCGKQNQSGFPWSQCPCGYAEAPEDLSLARCEGSKL